MSQSVAKIIDPKILKRWMLIIQILMLPKVEFKTKADIATSLKVNRRTIGRDLKDPDFQLLLKEELNIRIKSDVKARALNNVFELVNDGDPGMTKWFLENYIYLKSLTEKVTMDGGTIDGEFTEITDTALSQTNGQTGELIDALNTVQRLIGE